ncbi:ImmA/IrrE family metallo-endopeptidase [Marinobacterium sp. D7]|uniref:ImmA/IrrE family metallo-endopeptidase n=1 Tax=Marinobacterium ramblicola TaxID=2849041 RepID=UPI001C2D7C9C|nr:ImmA/IrrE family metallo-endopeptidase [Marinobacterium ramblicola]MBV1790194.1 ImmA/IrrE family metallo-endopeptidase [Marinobacterium ramblicola]
MAKKLRLGSDNGILLQLEPVDKRGKGADLAWGGGLLLLEGRPVLSGENGEPIEWTWIDLLEWLARHWAALLLEQSFPFSLPTTGISTLWRDLEQRWEDMAEERVEDEEEEACRFMARHDLSSAFKGIFFPGVYLMRTGQRVEVTAADSGGVVHMPLPRVVADLESIGNGLAELVAVSSQGRGYEAARQWYGRQAEIERHALPMLTGLSRSSLDSFGGNDAHFWEYDPQCPLQDTELMAAARMTSGVLSFEGQQRLLDRLRNIPKGETPELDELSQSIDQDFKEIGRPYDQGYWAAIWLRRRLGLQDQVAVDPAQLLRHWGVGLYDMELDDTALDALACWGPHHGPAILLNALAAPSQAYRKNSTLAHEICHLLLDRSATLPVAEVLNGHAPERLEKRARAFAAELLLPRRTAAAVARDASSIQQSVNSLSTTYNVSEELASWQVINSDLYAALNEEEKGWLQSRGDRAGH